jgi:hypothetical protein
MSRVRKSADAGGEGDGDVPLVGVPVSALASDAASTGEDRGVDGQPDLVVPRVRIRVVSAAAEVGGPLGGGLVKQLANGTQQEVLFRSSGGIRTVPCSMFTGTDGTRITGRRPLRRPNPGARRAGRQVASPE